MEHRLHAGSTGPAQDDALLNAEQHWPEDLPAASREAQALHGNRSVDASKTLRKLSAAGRWSCHISNSGHFPSALSNKARNALFPTNQPTKEVYLQ